MGKCQIHGNQTTNQLWFPESTINNTPCRHSVLKLRMSRDADSGNGDHYPSEKAFGNRSFGFGNQSKKPSVWRVIHFQQPMSPQDPSTALNIVSDPGNSNHTSRVGLESARQKWCFPEIGHFPKSSIFAGFSTINQPFLDTPHMESRNGFFHRAATAGLFHCRAPGPQGPATS